ncbi:MAG: cation-transporting P-type ATPase [Pseudomonadota bacterium]
MNLADALRGGRSDDPSLIDFTDLASALGTDLSNGLGAEEAAQRLQTHGPNELRAVPLVPSWRRMLAQLQGPLVYLLCAAAAVAQAAWWFEGRGQPGAAGWPLDAIVIAVGRVCGDGQRRAVVQRRAKAAATTPATPGP